MRFPPACTRLIEVDFPLVEVNDYSGTEKKKKTGTLGSIHVWWARRPLSACRSVLLGALLPDPADARLPPETAKQILKAIEEYQSKGQRGLDDVLPKKLKTPEQQRQFLIEFIGKFSNWDRRTNQHDIKFARKLIEVCYGDDLPRVIDPFAGGGSIPLEAARLGLPVVASDLNPIPLLLNSAQLQVLPSKGPDFLVSLKEASKQVNEKLEKALSVYFPPSPNRDETVIGYVCAREIVCEGVGCGIRYPLMTSGWLANSKKNQIAWTFKVRSNKTLEVGIMPNPPAKVVRDRTVRDGDATCPNPDCNYTTPVESVRRQLSAQRGGSRHARLLAVISAKKGTDGRFYRLPTQKEFDAYAAAKFHVEELERSGDPHWNVDEPLPPEGTLGFRVQLYGMRTWSDLYSPRQLLTQLYACKFISEIEDKDVRLILAFAASKFARRNCTLAGWMPDVEFFGDVFRMQTIQMSWDYFEGNPANEVGGINWDSRVKGVLQGLKAAELGGIPNEVQVLHGSATHHPLPDGTQDFLFTDPPYYDSVPYANLSDFFLVWLKRCIEVPWLERGLAPKAEEAIMDPNATGYDGQTKSGEWFEREMGRAMAEGRRLVRPTGMGCVVFAHTSTEGWSTILKAIIDGGWTVTASWPISSEMEHRLRAQRSAALETSVHIVMRPRGDEAGVGDWAVIQRALPKKISDWMRRLTSEGILGADAVFSCIGPAMELYSKYESVERADGSRIDVAAFLSHVWNVVAHEALKTIMPESTITDLPDDARFAVITLWTLRSSGSNGNEAPTDDKLKASASELPFDAARLLAQAIGADLDALKDQRKLVKVVKTSKGSLIRLLSPVERRQILLEDEAQQEREVVRAPQVQVKLGEDAAEARERADAAVVAINVRTRPSESPFDKLQQAMLLHADGHTAALDRLVGEEIGDDPLTWQLAQTLNALYPEGTWERNKIEGVIARHKALSRGN